VGIYVNTNLMALNAYQNLATNQMNMQSNLEKLSSGFRINKAADDAAGLTISEELRSQVNGFQQATSNAQQGINLVQTAEGALNEVTAILQRVRTLTVQAANGTTDSTGLSAIAAEVSQSLQEVDQIASNTVYGKLSLLATGVGGSQSFTFQVGQLGGSNNQITVSIGASDSAALSIGGLYGSFNTNVNAAGALASIDSAIATVETIRGNLGAYQNRLQHSINSLNVSVQNLTASESSIRDTDMAATMVEFTKSQILVQAGVSMLAQANSAPQSVLKLLG
jgi:flagellin